MAARSRRSLATSFSHLTHRFHPSLAHLLPHSDRRNGDDHHHPSPPPPSPFPIASSWPPPVVSSGLGAAVRVWRGTGVTLPLGLETSSLRSYSSSSGGSNEIEYMKDMADVFSGKGVDVASVLTDKGVDAAASVVVQAGPIASEVAVAAADSAIPVAALQHLIDAVHSFTGLHWWAAIAVTTLLIRTATVPLLINQMKTTTKLSLLRPEMEEIKEQMQNSMDPQSMQLNQKRMKALFKKHGVNPFTPLKGLFIQGPVFVSFFMAISNMVEKVPSFKEGGPSWFTDLTTPDPFYMLPILTSLTFLATVEFNMQEGMEGNPMAGTMKKFFRVLGVCTIPFTATFPKALFCYWVTSNLFSLTYGMVLKRPPVRKFLNLPDINAQAAAAEPSAGHKPSFPFFWRTNQSTPTASSPPLPVEKSQAPGRKISSSTVISQRILNLEKTVKSRKKPKKR